MAKKRVTPGDAGQIVSLGGKELRISYDFEALSLMFEITGVNILHGWQAELFSPKEVTAFLFCGARRFQPEVEYAWCAQQLNYKNYEEVMKLLVVALKGDLPEPSAEPVPEGNG